MTPFIDDPDYIIYIARDGYDDWKVYGEQTNLKRKAEQFCMRIMNAYRLIGEPRQMKISQDSKLIHHYVIRHGEIEDLV